MSEINTDSPYEAAVAICEAMREASNRLTVEFIEMQFERKFQAHKAFKTRETMVELSLMAHTLRVRVEDERNKKN